MYLQFNLTFYWRAKRAYIVAILAILFKTGYFGYFLGLLATFEITLVHFGYLRCVWLLFCGCGYFGYFLLRWRWNRGLTVSGNAGEYKVDFHKELQRLESVGVKMRFRLPSSSASLSRATLLCSCCRKSKNDTLYFVSFLANNKRETTR